MIMMVRRLVVESIGGIFGVSLNLVYSHLFNIYTVCLPFVLVYFGKAFLSALLK